LTDDYAPTPVAAQDKTTDSGPRAVAKVPDIEPIDPDLVFNPDVQKKLHLSTNQVNQLVEAREKGAVATADQSKQVGEIDQQLKRLQEEMDRLQRDRQKATQMIQKSKNDHVKAAIPRILSRDAVQALQQMTLQSMRLSDVLLDAKVRARLELNDEQVKKIQEISEKRDTMLASYEKQHMKSASIAVFYDTTASQLNRDTFGDVFNIINNIGGDASEPALLKVLTPQQRAALERLSGTRLDSK